MIMNGGVFAYLLFAATIISPTTTAFQSHLLPETRLPLPLQPHYPFRSISTRFRAVSTTTTTPNNLCLLDFPPERKPLVRARRRRRSGSIVYRIGGGDR